MPLDVFQQVFSLSLLSNYVHLNIGTQDCIQQWLQLAMTFVLPSIDAKWTIVWGPVVWKKEPNEFYTGPDLSWYIAYHESLEFEDGSVRPAYVIAIAGTPPFSEYAWLEVDFAVHSVSDFDAWLAGGIRNPPIIVPATLVSQGKPYIATGTVNAVHIQLTTPAPEGASSAGMTLLDFIANLDPSGSPIVISTGHSLGGTLSTSLTLALVLAGAVSADRTLTYPIAGPSPGNIDFTELFVRTFPPRKSPGARAYQGWNLNLVNTLDIVPQAWCPLRRISPEQNLGNIPLIYGPPALRFICRITDMFIAHSLSSGVLYKPLPSQYFTGPRPIVPPWNLLEFLVTITLQHTKPYLDEVGVELPMPHLPLQLAGLGEKSDNEIRCGYPVIANFQWAYENPERAEEIIKEFEATPLAKQSAAETQTMEA